jgi:hypothetical protein
VDDLDVAEIEACGLRLTPFDCRFADLNCDGVLDEADHAILDCQHNGPDLPPNTGCCPDALPNVAVHATSLAATGEAALIAGTWTEPKLNVFDRGGRFEQTLELDVPAGKLAGTSLGLLGDANGDGAVGLPDYAVLQRCLPVGGVMVGDRTCAALDLDFDDDVDLGDYAEFFPLANAGP